MSNEDGKTLSNIASKLSVLIALSLKNVAEDVNFEVKGRSKKGTGDLARFLADFGLDAIEIAQILGAPLSSIRTQLTPQMRKK
ncbi:MAG: hypothetical protein HRF51_13045 [bacterium]|jgi:hypothetical protein